MADYEKIMRSSQFVFVVGEEKTPLLIHSAVVEKLSAPLHALISNGSMKKSKAGLATLDDVDLETFVAFSEFAYTNDYKTPVKKNDTKNYPQAEVVKAYRISKRRRWHNHDLENLRIHCNNS